LENPPEQMSSQYRTGPYVHHETNYMKTPVYWSFGNLVKTCDWESSRNVRKELQE